MVASIAKAASDTGYYSSDGYYNEGTNGYEESMAWHGEGAKILGLEDFKTADFKAIMDGYVIGTDQRLGRMRGGKHEHRTGTDITFSAPKSVSLAALIGGDKRVTEAHNKAVATTLNYIEKNLLESRQVNKETGQLERVKGQKMVGATFVHEVNRNLDPNLHSHAVIANMVQGEDGKWRAVENNSLYKSIKMIGAIYHSELAHALKDLGYGIESKGTNGLFQLTDAAGKPVYSQEVQDAFSTRSADIKAALEAKGLDPTNSILRQRAALMTREAKENPDWQDLRNHWEKQALANGHTMGELKAQASNENTEGEIDRQKTPEMASGQTIDTAALPEASAHSTVEWAIRHLEERNSVFDKVDLVAAALNRDQGNLQYSAVEKAIGDLTESGRLVDTSNKYDEAFTTDKALAAERENIGHLTAGQGASKAIVKDYKVRQLLDKTNLTDGQRDAVQTILTSDDRIVGVQGYAGSGKTTMLDTMRGIVESESKTSIIGLAPSASAAKTLEAESSIESRTLQSFLAKYSAISEGRAGDAFIKTMQEDVKGSIIVVDEASLASTSQMRDMLRITDALQPQRVVLVGDVKQLDAVDAGKPFHQLQQAGMNTAVMDQIMRQRDENLKAAVIESLSGEPAAALARLDKDIVEVSRGGLAPKAAKTWLGLSPEDREKTALLAPTHHLRQEINGIIRTQLTNEGVLHGESATITQLTSTRLTEAERELPSNYQTGQKVLFERGIESLGISTGDTLTVDSKTDDMVSLTDKDGESVSFDPAGGIAAHLDIYQASEIELQAGDIIRWTRNDKEMNLTNTHQAEVLGIGGDGTITLKTEDGRTLEMDINAAALGHSDYAFNSTVHAYQGRTVDNVIAILDSTHQELTNQKTMYVEISRAKEGVILITDNKAALIETLEANTGERLSALEGIDERLTGGKDIDAQLTTTVEEARKEYGMSFDEFQSMDEGMPIPDPSYDPDYGYDPDLGDDPSHSGEPEYEQGPDHGHNPEHGNDYEGVETEPRQDIAANDSNHEKDHAVKQDLEFEI